MSNNKAIAHVQNQIMLSWKAVMNYEQQLRDIGHDQIIEDCIAVEKEKVYIYTTILNQLETSVNQAKAILKDAGYYVDNLWHIDDVKGLKDMNDDDAYAILDTILSGDYIIEDIANSINQATQKL
jgi:hypothetical protein